MWTVQPFHLPIIRKKYTSMRTPIRCSAAVDSGSFTTVSAIGSRGHIAVPKGQYGRGVFAVLSTTIDNVGLSSSFTYIPQSPLIVTRYFLALGGYSPTKSGTGGGLRCSPFTHKSYGVFWVLDAAPTRCGQPASPCVTIMLGLVGQSCLSRRKLHCWTHLRYRQMVGSCSYNHDCHSQ